MTHPDIVKMEKFGCLDPETPLRRIGNCLCCGEELYDDGLALVESTDGIFCSLACCHEYYEIQTT